MWAATEAMRCSVGHIERSTYPTGQEAIYSILWLTEEHVTVARCSITPSHYTNDIPECHDSTTKPLKVHFGLSKATCSKQWL